MPLLQKQITEELESLCLETSSDFAALSFTTKQEPRLRWRYAYGSRNDRYKQMIIKPGVGPAGLSLRTGKPTNWSKHLTAWRELPMHCPLVTAEQLLAAAAIPLIDGERIYGILLMARRTTEDAYKEHELTSLQLCKASLRSLLEVIT